MKTALKYGVLIGFVGFIWNCLEYFSGLQTSQINSHLFITLLFPIVVLLVLIKALRERKGNSYGNIFLLGFQISLMGAIASIIFGLIFYNFINKNFFNDLLLAGRDWIGKSATSEESFQRSNQLMERIFSLKTYLILGGIFDLLFGIVFTAVIALFVRRKH